MEKQKEKRPQAPLYIDSHDIQLIEDCELHTARRRLTQIKKSQGLGKKDKLSIWAYCKANKISLEQVAPYYLRVLILSAAACTILAFGRYLFQYSCKYFRDHKMEIEENTPNSIKAHTYEYNPQTKKMEKITIEIQKIK